MSTTLANVDVVGVKSKLAELKAKKAKRKADETPLDNPSLFHLEEEDGEELDEDGFYVAKAVKRQKVDPEPTEEGRGEAKDQEGSREGKKKEENKADGEEGEEEDEDTKMMRMMGIPTGFATTKKK